MLPSQLLLLPSSPTLLPVRDFALCFSMYMLNMDVCAAVVNIIRQGRGTLVATIQMYKILALNCLISAWALSVQYLQGIKFGDYQVTITGILMSICFMCISRARVGSFRILHFFGMSTVLTNFSSTLARRQAIKRASVNVDFQHLRCLQHPSSVCHSRRRLLVSHRPLRAV